MPPTASRRRAGYPQPYTRNDLLRSRQYADPATMSEVVRCTIDGRIIGDELIYRRGPSIHETRMAPKDSELEIAARALVKLGEHNVAFETGEQPDWRVTLAAGRRVGIEVTEANPSADLTNRVEDLNVALKDAVDAEALRTDHFIEFSFGPLAFQSVTSPEAIQAARARGLPPPSPASALTARARRELLKEMHAYLRARKFASGRIDGYATLRAFDINAYASPSLGHDHVALGLGGTVFSMMGAYAATVKRINHKLQRAVGYDQTHPLWLIVCITDTTGLFTDSVVAFERMQLNVGLFSRIIVTDGMTSRILDRT
jgi:hypothetical protein